MIFLKFRDNSSHVIEKNQSEGWGSKSSDAGREMFGKKFK